ncbi:MAG: IclR family transcriptional regulator [Rhodospirillaceae bacterium]
MNDMERGRGGVQAVHLTFDILEELMAAQEELGVSELTQRMGSSKGTVFRHLQTLVERGYLSQNPRTQRYRLGVRAHLLGEAARGSMDLLAIGTEALVRLQAATRQTAILSRVGGRKVTVLTAITGPSALEIGVKPGSDLPLHASAQGKVALAFSRRGLLTAMRRQKLTKLTDRTVTSIAVLEEQIATVRATGWASAYEEMMLGINGVAVPVFDETGDCVASLAIVGSIQFVQELPSDALLGALLESGAGMSAALGYRP